MFRQTDLKTVTFMSARHVADSSTDSPDIGALQCFTLNANRRDRLRLSGEVCLWTMAWPTGVFDRACCQPVDAFEERKESALCGVSQEETPNRKERFKSTFPPLLIDANTSGMGLFGDQQQHQNAAADEGMMDRGAERTAGGCNAI